MFERPKIVVQRIRGKGSIKASVDRSGVFLGHTCTVVQLNDDIIPLERLLELICSPLVAAVMKIERGQTMDLYPREVASFPVPTTWLRDSREPLKDALGLTADDQIQLGRWVSNA